MNESKINKELIFSGMAFTFFLFITCYRLTNASLWFDETIEYWYSKVAFGPLPFETSANMYQRILSTYQPPLYNVIMHFWLKFSDAEWWFRFFGVVIGFIGMIGIYKSVKKLSNFYVASFAVFFSSTVYQLVYYWQECAEYCLMIGTLCWTVYFWICLLQEVNLKNILFFIISSVIPVYSQYGAVFPVAAMLLSVLLFVALQKDKKNLAILSVSYLGAFLLTALPLFFLFLKKQMQMQQGGEIGASAMSFTGGFIKDFWNSLENTFKWSFFSYYSDIAVRIFLVAILAIIFISLLMGKNRLVKWMISFNIITYVIYYFIVKLDFYSYGSFGNRYNLFFIPLWIILFFAVCFDIYQLLSKEKTLWHWNITDIRYLLTGFLIASLFCYGTFSWSAKLRENWLKDDIRGVVDAWYLNKAYMRDTLVYYSANSGFAYYLRQHENYVEDLEASVHYMGWLRDRSVEEYTAYIDKIYGEDWPHVIYVAASHQANDLNTLLESITAQGYSQQDVFYSVDGRMLQMVYIE